MNEDNEKIFIESAGASAGKAVAFAIERNLPMILNDIERYAAVCEDDGSEARKMDVVIKVSFYHPRPFALKTTVREVRWARKTTFSDKDFPSEEVDIMQPELPLFENAANDLSMQDDNAPDSYGCYKDESLGTHTYLGYIGSLSMRNLINAARKIGCDIFRPCDWKDTANHERSVLRWNHISEKWENALCPDVNSVQAVLEAAESAGNLVLTGDNPTITFESSKKLGKEGYGVVRWNTVEVQYKIESEGMILTSMYNPDTQ